MRKLKEIREDLSMSQEALARKTGYSQKTVSRYERGVQKPSLRAARIFANALHIDLAEVAEFQELLGSIYDQGETAEESPFDENEIEAEEIVVTDPRILKRMESSPQPEPKTQPVSEPELPSADKPELEPEPSRQIVVAQNNPNQTTNPEGNVASFEPGKASIGLPIIYGLSRLSGEVILVIICVAIAAVASYFIYRSYSRRAQQQREADTPRKPQTVNGFLAAY